MAQRLEDMPNSKCGAHKNSNNTPVNSQVVFHHTPAQSPQSRLISTSGVRVPDRSSRVMLALVAPCDLPARQARRRMCACVCVDRRRVAKHRCVNSRMCLRDTCLHTSARSLPLAPAQVWHPASGLPERRGWALLAPAQRVCRHVHLAGAVQVGPIGAQPLPSSVVETCILYTC